MNKITLAGKQKHWNDKGFDPLWEKNQ